MGYPDGLPSVAGTLLPTPTASEANGPGPMNRRGVGTLRSRVRLLKTPTSNLGSNGGSQHPDKRKRGGHGPNLADEVEHLLPTPTVADSRGTRTRRRDGAPYGEGHGKTLTDAATLLPTPRASDGTKGSPNQKHGDGSLTLASTAARLLPTRTATPYGSNQSPSPGASVRPSLEPIAPALLPTPSASDHGSNYATAEERAAQGHQVYLSNATTSIGARTRKRSADGNGSPGPLPGQLTIEAA
ncbi:hypothetical protein [Streptomyces sp. NA04227]|uniref:hypothetical protein n=1 Tax=Streptomyces sp. NA04227 TaxID=2742136 RepID=UPI0020CA3679|nr:hypothetical protein [Streptomyces sp. NA04227]